MSHPRSSFAYLAGFVSRLLARFRSTNSASDTPETLAPSPPQPRARWKRWAIELAIGIAIFAGVAYWRAADLPSGPAPLLAGQLADGRAADLAEILTAAGGRPVLVAFWATWCPICKAEEGNIDAIARDWPTLTVAMQSGERMTVAKHLHDRGLGFPALIDASGSLAGEWRVRGVPTHFIVDRHGVIRYQSVGYATEYGLRARLWWIGRQS